jgi:transcriptional regulator with XRE-family HTH domain
MSLATSINKNIIINGEEYVPSEKVFKEKLSLSKVLKSLRLCDEMTLKDFSKILGISARTLSHIEHGRKGISPERAAHFARKLGYPIETFVKLALNDLLKSSKLPLEVETLKDANKNRRS